MFTKSSVFDVLQVFKYTFEKDKVEYQSRMALLGYEIRLIYL